MTTDNPDVKRKAADKPSVVDQLAEDAVPPEYPEGVPELQSWLQIRPRSRRAEFKRRYAEVIEFQKLVSERHKGVTDKSPLPDQMRMAADMDDLCERIDRTLEIAAADLKAYRAWSDEVDDNTLIKTFNVFSVRSQPGEASSSAS